MIRTATRLMEDGASPSVSDVAKVACVSRSTAYRYFPDKATMVHAVMGEALGPILDWRPDAASAEERVEALFRSSYPRILAHEATFRAALRLSLEGSSEESQASEQIGPARQGHRIELLRRALANVDGGDARGARDTIQPDRLAHALSLVFGIESIVVLRDIWGMDDAQITDVVTWIARTLVRAAQEERSS